MSDLISSRPEGVHLLISPVMFTSGSSITTLVGCTITAFAEHPTSGVETAATSTSVISATSAEAKWSVGSLVPARYLVHVYATASGGEAVRIYAGYIVVLEKLGP